MFRRHGRLYSEKPESYSEKLLTHHVEPSLLGCSHPLMNQYESFKAKLGHTGTCQETTLCKATDSDKHRAFCHLTPPEYQAFWKPGMWQTWRHSLSWQVPLGILHASALTVAQAMDIYRFYRYMMIIDLRFLLLPSNFQILSLHYFFAFQRHPTKANPSSS